MKYLSIKLFIITGIIFLIGILIFILSGTLFFKNYKKNLQEEQKKTMLEIAHALQTPLTILKGELSLLIKNESENKKINELQKLINRISKLIYDMLKIARLENREQPANKTEINLSQQLYELLESLEVIIKEKGIKIKIDIEDNLFVLGDRNELDELVTNLTSNCVKYIGNGHKKEIEVKLIGINEKILLAIKDTGIGIDKRHLSYLFHRFYRITDERNDNFGTGLGLYITKKIVERHDGEIKVESEINQGTKFTIILPRLK